MKSQIHNLCMRRRRNCKGRRVDDHDLPDKILINEAFNRGTQSSKSQISKHWKNVLKQGKQQNEKMFD